MVSHVEKRICSSDDKIQLLEAKDHDRLRSQINFIVEADKLKNTLRQTVLTDGSRRENSAEHSWHIALCALVLSEYATDGTLDVLRVIQMLIVHDLVEIDAGDTYCYDEKGREDQAEREEKAADRIFNILPPDQSEALRALWDEYEARATPESRFANALDRFQPLLNNYVTEGESWKQHGIKRSQVMERMKPVGDGAPAIWAFVCEFLEDAVERGYLGD